MLHRRLLSLLLTALLSLTAAVTAQSDSEPMPTGTPPGAEETMEGAGVGPGFDLPEEEADGEAGTPAPEPSVPESPLLAEASQQLDSAEGTYVAIGNSVLLLDGDGIAVWRKAVSGMVTLLEEAEEGGVSVVTALRDGLSERIALDANGRASATIRFSADPQVLGSLRREAAAGDAEARLAFDATNPYLYLELARDEQDDGARAELEQQAVAAATTFYDLAGVAVELAAAGSLDPAGQAMELALRDFAARGYDAALLTDPDIHAAYNFPLPQLQAALSAGDDAAADFWAGWTEAFLSPNVPWVSAALGDYAAALDARGDAGAAADWRERAAAGASNLALTGVDRLFSSIGSSGWYMFASLVFVILALQVTLTFKYWEPQTLAMRRSLETGGSANVMQRLLAIRFFSTTEKLVLALLYVSGFAMLGLTSWAARPATAPAVFGAGTLAGAEAQDALGTLELSGVRGEFILGYAAQQGGDADAAGQHYRAAGNFGPALNNLGVLLDDAGLWDEARRRAPALPEPRLNSEGTGQSVFDRLAGLDRAVLVAPGPLDYRAALQGTWQQALSAIFVQPWKAFTIQAPWLPLQWLWYLVLGLYVLLGVLTVLWILVPRPRLARNAPRSIAYHVLALLVPGSGMADELWGIMLLVPWGIVGVDALWRLSGAEPLLALSVPTLIIALAILYALNLAAFIVEFSSYRRRMRQLFRTSPEAGVAYGRRIAPSNEQA